MRQVIIYHYKLSNKKHDCHRLPLLSQGGENIISGGIWEITGMVLYSRIGVYVLSSKVLPQEERGKEREKGGGNTTQKWVLGDTWPLASGAARSSI